MQVILLTDIYTPAYHDTESEQDIQEKFQMEKQLLNQRELLHLPNKNR